MGLTVHYQLRLPGTVTQVAAERLVRTAHSRAASLVRRHKLAGITRVLEADPDAFLSRRFVTEKRNGDTVGHEVPPERGWLFSVQPGQDCESVVCGLAFYPAAIRVGRRTLRTGCGGWGYSGFCKTQYASLHGEENFLRCHRAVIDLLLVWERLGAKVKISDEGGYWPGRNEAALRASLTEMNRLLAAFAGALKDAVDKGGPSVESPIFQHGQFELLEAQGMSHYAAMVGRAVGAVGQAVRPSGEGKRGD